MNLRFYPHLDAAARAFDEHRHLTRTAITLHWLAALGLDFVFADDTKVTIQVEAIQP